MGAVVELPETMLRQWRVVEKDLRAACAAGGMSDREIDHIAATMKPFFLKYSASQKLVIDPNVDIEGAINEWVRNIISGTFLEVAIREVELLRAGLR